MFRWWKRPAEKQPQSSNSLFAVPMRVRPRPESSAPKEIAGAFVVCYAGAPDHLEAVRRAHAKLRHDHLEFIDMAGEVQELDPGRWDDYVTASWMEFAESLPEQDDLLAVVSRGEVFYGPFCGYDES